MIGGAEVQMTTMEEATTEIERLTDALEEIERWNRRLSDREVPRARFKAGGATTEGRRRHP